MARELDWGYGPCGGCSAKNCVGSCTKRRFYLREAK
jgi:hypothetical protein